MKAKVENLKNEVVGEIELPAAIFGANWNSALVAQVLRAQLANRRRPWAHAKDRSEVRGGGRKPWRQKGTGRARHGSIRSPLWVGGGKAHGPVKTRDYTQKINKKMRQNALFSALSKRFKEKEIRFFDNFNLEVPKTKLLAGALKNVLGLKKFQKNYNALIIADSGNKNVFRASANIPKTKATRPESLNLYDALSFKNILIEKEAVGGISRHYNKIK